MIKKETLSSIILKFIFAQLGIYFLLFLLFIFILSLIFSGDETGDIPIFLFIFAIIFKNFLSYYSLFSTRAIKQFNVYNKLVVPFLIFDLGFIYLTTGFFSAELTDKLFLATCMFLLSTSFSVLSLQGFIKVKNIIKK